MSQHISNMQWCSDNSDSVNLETLQSGRKMPGTEFHNATGFVLNNLESWLSRFHSTCRHANKAQNHKRIVRNEELNRCSWVWKIHLLFISSSYFITNTLPLFLSNGACFNFPCCLRATVEKIRICLPCADLLTMKMDLAKISSVFSVSKIFMNFSRMKHVWYAQFLEHSLMDKWSESNNTWRLFKLINVKRTDLL